MSARYTMGNDIRNIIAGYPECIEKIKYIKNECFAQDRLFLYDIIKKSNDNYIKDISGEIDPYIESRICASPAFHLTKMNMKIYGDGANTDEDIGNMHSPIESIIKKEYIFSQFMKTATYAGPEHLRYPIQSCLGDLCLVRSSNVLEIFSNMIEGIPFVVDFSEDLACWCLTQGFRSQEMFRPYLDSERGIVISKIRDALTLIERDWPNHFNIITAFVLRAICFRAEGGVANAQKTSTSFSETPYCIYLANIENNSVSVMDVADMIVHESVHCLVSCFERIYGYLPGRVDREPVVSPWSGQLLRRQSLCHAVFVYYAGYKFFSSVSGPSDEIKKNLRRVLSGFLGNADLRFICAANDSTEDDVVKVISEIQAEVRASLHIEEKPGQVNFR